MKEYIGHFDDRYFVYYNQGIDEYELCYENGSDETGVLFGIVFHSRHMDRIRKEYNKMKAEEKLVNDLYLSNLSIEELQSLKPSIFDTVIDARIKELQDAAKTDKPTEDTVAQ